MTSNTTRPRCKTCGRFTRRIGLVARCRIEAESGKVITHICARETITFATGESDHLPNVRSSRGKTDAPETPFGILDDPFGISYHQSEKHSWAEFDMKLKKTKANQ